MFRLKEWAGILDEQKHTVNKITLDQCKFGAFHLKATDLIGTVDVSTLVLKCDHTLADGFVLAVAGQLG